MSDGLRQLDSDHDRLVHLDERVRALGDRMVEIIDYKHNTLPVVIVGIQKELSGVSRDLIAQAVSIGHLSTGMEEIRRALAEILPFKAKSEKVAADQEAHENSCMEAHRENEARLTNIERKIDESTTASNISRQQISDRVAGARMWAMGAAISAMVGVISLLLAVIGAFVMKGGLGVFHQ